MRVNPQKRMLVFFELSMRTWYKVKHFMKALKNWHWSITHHYQVSIHGVYDVG
jgi:hypothetical protein